MGLSNEQAEIVTYGFAVFVSNLAGIVLIVIISWLLGVVQLALVAAFTAAGLRVLSGGAHSASIRNCSLLGAIVSPTIAIFSRLAHIYFSSPLLSALVTAVWLLGLWAVYKYAPADTPNKPITEEKMKKRLRRLSRMYLVAWFILWGGSACGIVNLFKSDVILAGTLGLMWQIFSLTPFGYRLVAMVDRMLP